MNLSIETVTSPLGVLTCVVKDGAVVALEFEENAERLRRSLQRRFGAVTLAAALAESDAARRIAAYFAGDLAALEGLAADPGGTPFEQRVYKELRRIPRGEVTTYAAIARRIGKPEAVRAVGAANAKNPVSIVVPCHRVIGADGSLTGYAGGLERKRWLLAHESGKLLAEQGLLGASRAAHGAAPGDVVNGSASGAGSRPDRSRRAAARSEDASAPRCSA